MNDEKDIKNVENIFGECLNKSFMISSPITGEVISVIRLTDIYMALCSSMNVDTDKTEYKAYGH